MASAVIDIKGRRTPNNERFYFSSFTVCSYWTFLRDFLFKTSRKNKNKNKTCESEGIAIGMCMGVGLGTMFEGGLALGVSIGVLLGLCIGSRIPKKDNNDEQHNKE